VTNDELLHRDRDLWNALRWNDIALPADIVDIVATLTRDGTDRGIDWYGYHWLVVLADGQCAYVTGCNGESGWSYSDCEAFVEPDMGAAIRQIPEAYRDELVAQLPESTRRSL
jgi:hypothetical protein